MKTQILITAACALAAGSVGGMVAAGSGSDSPPATGGLVSELADLRAELSRVRAENERLAERLESIENRPAVASATPVRADAAQPTNEEIEAIQADLAQLAQALRDPKATLPPNFKDQISNVLTELREEEEKRRREEREQREKERFEERLQEIAKELNLNTYQVNELRGTIDRAKEELESARDAFRETRDFDGMREAMEKIREEARTDLGRYLTSDQISTMDEKYLSGRGSILGGFGGRGGFGGGRGGFGGGRGG